MSELHPAVPQVAATRKSYGMINKLLVPQNIPGATVHEWLDWVVRNWDIIEREHFKWLNRAGESGFPKVPNIQIVIAHRRGFLDAWGRKEELDRIDRMSPRDATIERFMRKKHMTREQATAELDKILARKGQKANPSTKKKPSLMSPIPVPRKRSKEVLKPVQPVAITGTKEFDATPIDLGRFEDGIKPRGTGSGD